MNESHASALAALTAEHHTQLAVVASEQAQAHHAQLRVIRDEHRDALEQQARVHHQHLEHTVAQLDATHAAALDQQHQHLTAQVLAAHEALRTVSATYEAQLSTLQHDAARLTAVVHSHEHASHQRVSDSQEGLARAIQERDVARAEVLRVTAAVEHQIAALAAVQDDNIHRRVQEWHVRLAAVEHERDLLLANAAHREAADAARLAAVAAVHEDNLQRRTVEWQQRVHTLEQELAQAYHARATAIVAHAAQEVEETMTTRAGAHMEQMVQTDAPALATLAVSATQTPSTTQTSSVTQTPRATETLSSATQTAGMEVPQGHMPIDSRAPSLVCFSFLFSLRLVDAPSPLSFLSPPCVLRCRDDSTRFTGVLPSRYP